MALLGGRHVRLPVWSLLPALFWWLLPAEMVGAIYRGEDATIDDEKGLLEFPPFVALMFIHKHVPGRISSCGAALYKHTVLLTAAHCLRAQKLGDIGQWDVKAFLQPRLNPRLVVGDSVTEADFKSFTQDQGAGFGVGLPIDVGRTLFHSGYRSEEGALPGVGEIMKNDLALIPLKRPLNVSSDPSFWASFATEFPGMGSFSNISYRVLGLGELGSELSPAVKLHSGTKVCFNGSGMRLPCKLQAKTVEVLPYPECQRQCVAWLTDASLGVEPTGAPALRKHRSALGQVVGPLCSSMLEGVREGRLLCAHHPAGSAASGDSGGPLLAHQSAFATDAEGIKKEMKSGGRALPQVAGILSWTDIAATDAGDLARMPALYESTAFHRVAIDRAVDCLSAESAVSALQPPPPGACIFSQAVGSFIHTSLPAPTSNGDADFLPLQTFI